MNYMQVPTRSPTNQSPRVSSAFDTVELAPVFLARRCRDDVHQEASGHRRRAHDGLEKLRELAARVEGRHLLRCSHRCQLALSRRIDKTTQQHAPMSVSTGPGHCGNATANQHRYNPRQIPSGRSCRAQRGRTQPRVLEVDFTRDPVQRGLARGVRRQVQRVRRREVKAPRHGADGDEARQRAGLEQRADGLEEHDGAEDVDLRVRDT
jgi:hypothetical protein